MNTMPPPARDLPPARHAEIRATVVRAADRRARWVVPALAAAAALVTIGLVMWFVPAGDEETVRPAETTASRLDREDEIARKCAQDAGLTGHFELRQLIGDEAGWLAAVYTDEYVLDCDVDSYSANLGLLMPFTPPITLDVAGATAGGNVRDDKPEYVGRPGWEFAIGRVAPEVTKVTVTQGEHTVNASLAEGTFAARIIHPADWRIPDGNPPPVIRAYDADGNLLATL